MFTNCKFCEKAIKNEEYEEHRQNCFTENLATIQGYKLASLPKECPKDHTHILYQWPEKISKTAAAGVENSKKPP